MSSSVIYIKQLLKKEWMCRAECKQSRDVPTCMTPQLRIKYLPHDSSRQNVLIIKEANEAFGFEIKTNTNDCKLVTYVCSVTKNSPAKSSGINTGDVIISVNNTSVVGFSHRQIVDLIQKGTCLLKLGIVKCTTVKQKELQQKLHNLQMQLKDKREELQRLISQEEHLKQGDQSESQAWLAVEFPTFPSSLLI